MVRRFVRGLKRIFSPPQVLTPYEYYQLRMLWSVVCAMVVVLAALTVYSFFDVVVWPWVTFAAVTAVFIVQVIVLLMGKRGHLRSAAALEIGTSWLFIAYGAYFSGGIYATVVMIFFIPLVLSVVMLGHRAGLVFLLLTLAYLAFLLGVELAGLLPDVPLKVLPYRMMLLSIVLPAVFYLSALHIRQMQKMEKKNIELSAAAERMNVQQDLARNIAHDLRTPLTVLSTQLYLLKTRHARGLPIEGNLEQVEAYTQKLINMTEDFFLMTLLAERGSVDAPSWSFIDLGHMLREAVQTARQYGEARNITIDFVDECSRRCRIFGEAYFLEQTFNHLIANAVHYNNEGGFVRVVLRDEPGWVVVDVVDNGVGMAEDVQERIFEPFFRANAARTMDERIGSGIGLAIVKRIIELHRGTIRIQSKVDHGTTVTVKLPLQQP